MKRLHGLVAAAWVVGVGSMALCAAQVAQSGAAETRARANQAPVNLSGTWVPANARYGGTFTIAQDDRTITMTDRTAIGMKEIYNLDGSDSKNDGHVDAIFWNGNRLVVVRDNNNNMRTEYEVVNGQLHVTVGGKYIAYDKKSR